MALLDQKAVFIRARKIIEEKLDAEINSGTSCDEYVLRCIGFSDSSGEDKGDKFPDDVYKALQA